MSDPVTNVEIEDVLSSIRRLVSAEQRDDAAGDGAPDTPDEKETRLILTPALRVDDAPQDMADDGVTAGAEIDAAEAGAEEGFDDVEDAEIVDAPESREGSEKESARAEYPEFQSRRTESGLRLDTNAGTKDREAGALDASDEVETTVRGHIEDDAEQPLDLSGLETAEREEAFDAAAEDDQAELHLKELEARIAGFETAVAEQDDEWEPDGTSDDPYAGRPVSPLPWRDAGEAAAEDAEPEAEEIAAEAPEPEAPAEAQGEDMDDDGWYADDAILDEEALRDMVSEIVRQELQGALGERITRNVRKLVRREIHRALMSQGID